MIFEVFNAIVANILYAKVHFCASSVNFGRTNDFFGVYVLFFFA